MNSKPQFAVTFGLILLSFAGLTRAQALRDSLAPEPRQSFVITFSEDILYVVSSPLRLKKSDGPKLLLLTATTALFMASLDSRIDEDFIERDDVYVKPAIGLAKIGDGFDKVSAKYVLAGLSLPMLAGGLIFKDKKLVETSRLMAESFLIAGGITWTGKRVFGRARPLTGEGPNDFQWFNFNANQARRSFPSGHATTAFSMMTVLAKQYDSWWVEIPAYTIALSVALQRIDSHQHWGADVLVGSAIGYWVGNMLVSRHKAQSSAAAIHPIFFGNRVAFMVSF